MIKKLLLLVIFLNFSISYAAGFETNFTKDAFNQAQDEGKTVVIYSKIHLFDFPTPDCIGLLFGM